MLLRQLSPVFFIYNMCVNKSVYIERCLAIKACKADEYRLNRVNIPITLLTVVLVYTIIQIIHELDICLLLLKRYYFINSKITLSKR